jgi:soluble lytic murein transglycosylase-like protein
MGNALLNWSDFDNAGWQRYNAEPLNPFRSMSRIIYALLIWFGVFVNAYAQNADSIGASAGGISDARGQTYPQSDAAAASMPAAGNADGNAAVKQANRVSSLLVEKFGLARAKAEVIANAVMSSASKYSLPPALVLAVISVESRFREKARGTHGATGLMQVVPAAHRRLVRNIDLTQPVPNIEAGSAILHGYIESAQGDVAAALKSYGGSSAYAQRVSLRERDFEASVGASDAAAVASGVR